MTAARLDTTELGLAVRLLQRDAITAGFNRAVPKSRRAEWRSEQNHARELINFTALVYLRKEHPTLSSSSENDEFCGPSAADDHCVLDAFVNASPRHSPRPNVRHR